MNEKNGISFEDYVNSYLNETTIDCFKRCVVDLETSEVSKNEKLCVNNCFEKYFLSYSNMADIMNLKRKTNSL